MAGASVPRVRVMVGLGIGVGVEKVTSSALGEGGGAPAGAGALHAATIAASMRESIAANRFMVTVYREKNILAMGFVLLSLPECARICGVTDLGIVIVNHNTRDLLRDCLKSLFASTDVSFVTYVVDNGSTDASAQMARAEFASRQVCLIASQENGGYAYANNLGLREILRLNPPPRFTLLLNPDTTLPPDALAQMIAFFDAHPDAGVAGPKLVMADGSLDLACRRSFPNPELSLYHTLGLDKLFPHSPRFARYNLTFINENKTTEVDSVVGAFMLIRTSALLQAGLLDEIYFMYGEDLDLAMRIKRKGWKVYYYPGVEVLHYKRASSSQSSKAQYEFWRAAYIFYRRYYAATTALPMRALIVLGLAIKGGLQLVREMMQPLPTSPNGAELSGLSFRGSGATEKSRVAEHIEISRSARNDIRLNK